MGKGPKRKRTSRIKLKRKRRQKIDKLRRKYKTAKKEEEKKAIVEKALKINPNLTKETFIFSIQENQGL